MGGCDPALSTSSLPKTWQTSIPATLRVQWGSTGKNLASGHTLEHLEFIPVEKVGARGRMREADLIKRTGVLLAGLNLYR